MRLILAFALMALYFVPTILARRRGKAGTPQMHPNNPGVFVVNLLLGWTVVGWVIAFVWATWPFDTPQYEYDYDDGYEYDDDG